VTITNVRALREALEWATAQHLEQSGRWEQGEWFVTDPDEDPHRADGAPAAAVLENGCDTACCLAGRIVSANRMIRWFAEDESWLLDGRGFTWEVVALDVLGTNTIRSRYNRGLFDGDNSIFDLWRIAEDLTDGAIRMPAVLVEQHIAGIWDLHQYRVYSATV
jgi:hypothetical protein